MTVRLVTSNNKTVFEYNLFDQVTKIVHPDHVAGTHERIETLKYDSRGKLIEKSGAGGYPLVYRYDAVGNLAELQDANGRVTRWMYTPLNRVETKTYADNTVWTYAYNALGQIKSRLDPMGRKTAYQYNAYSLITTVDYPTDADIFFEYDQQGRSRSMTDGSGTTTWAFDEAGRPASETQSRAHRVLRYAYDAQSNRSSLEIASTDAPTTAWQTTYAYDNAARLHSVVDGRLPSGGGYTYSYLPGASLVGQVTTPTGLKTLKTYDNLGRLVSLAGQRSDSSPVNSFTYSYDAAGQRNKETLIDRTRDYTYDPWRQLQQAKESSNNTESRRHDYAFDGIGNRLTSSVTIGGATQATVYNTNAVNQYTRLTGVISADPLYDLNGNTKTLPGFTLVYDEENRLVEVSDSTHKTLYVYDGMGRRVERLNYVNGTATSLARFVYDGWAVMEELDSAYSTVRSYTRGLDLSNTMGGAGGVGGLLGFLQPDGAAFKAYSYFYDGNGNVSDLVSDAGSVAAHYVYSPFGERIEASGEVADSNPYQFSSKEREIESGLCYYGFRYYNPSTGRWLSRDPIQERGGVNLYGFVANDPCSNYDPFGRALKRYDIDISTLRMPSNDYADNRIGDEQTIWPRGEVARSWGSSVTIKGELEIRLSRRVGSGASRKGADGLTILEHEQWHAAIAKTLWNSNIYYVNKWEGEYCSTSCASAAADIANVQNEIGLCREQINNHMFDYTQYASEDGKSLAEEWTQELAKQEGNLARALEIYKARSCKKKGEG